MVMTAQRSTSPLDAQSSGEGNIRKRVCKACDRCRLKKSKCDGANPCGRCKTDNAICVFGERKKAHDKVYPKGYVEMLEQQQTQLVTGIQELYRRALEGEGWPGSPLKTSSSNGHPLTHDILERLGALKPDGTAETDSLDFEDDLHLVQQRLLSNGAGLMQRQESSEGSSNGGGDPSSSPTFTSSQAMFQGEPYASTNTTSTSAQFPPTPPNYSPYPRSSASSSSQHASAVAMSSTPKFQHPHPHPHPRPHTQQIPPQPPFYQQQQQQPTVGQMFYAATGGNPPAPPPPSDMDNTHTHSLSRQPSWSQFSDNMFDDSMDIFRGFDAQQPPHQQPTPISMSMSSSNNTNASNTRTSSTASSSCSSGMDYLHQQQQQHQQQHRGTGAPAAVTPAAGVGVGPFGRAPQTVVPTGLNSCLGQPDWNDEDFKAFLNPSPSLLS